MDKNNFSSATENSQELLKFKNIEGDFNKFESKVDAIMKILENMCAPDKDLQNKGLCEADKFIENKNCKSLDDVDEDSFIVKVRENKTFINNKAPSEINLQEYKNPVEKDKFTFMQEVEEDANKRAKDREKRENIAQNFRKLGNDAFRQVEYEKAINLYSKAIDHVKNSPILYNNRALCYIKLKLYKRSVIDCDFVINKLDDKNLRSWLYRATAYYAMDDEHNFNASLRAAKKTNSKKIDYIEKFIEDMKNLLST